MKFNVITLFPETIHSLTDYSILGRGIKSKIIEIETYNLRDFGLGKYKQVDDTPYGGGAGMLLKVDILDKAIEKVRAQNKGTFVILLTPKGQKYGQSQAKKLSRKDNITFVCGHYEGFDERIRELVDAEISIGDYVLSGGEIAAAAIIDSVSRLIPGVLGKEESHKDESFEDGMLEYPHYTNPREYKGMSVPEVLLSGNHGEIEKWRKEQAQKVTKDKRPDLK
ncbi:MAG: tRNA (guanosine(37)-N1)-methyltransferase TrmD [bacterium]|nr:tRNA (guanosine(37)-N1)-methyltransferase TrmD [bacterium]